MQKYNIQCNKIFDYSTYLLQSEYLSSKLVLSSGLVLSVHNLSLSIHMSLETYIYYCLYQEYSSLWLHYSESQPLSSLDSHLRHSMLVCPVLGQTNEIFDSLSCYDLSCTGSLFLLLHQEYGHRAPASLHEGHYTIVKTFLNKKLST